MSIPFDTNDLHNLHTPDPPKKLLDGEYVHISEVHKLREALKEAEDFMELQAVYDEKLKKWVVRSSYKYHCSEADNLVGWLMGDS